MPQKATQAITNTNDADAPVLVVVRLRGPIDVRGTIESTMKMLRLHRPNHAVLVRATPSILGMLHKVEHFVTYGEATEATVKTLLTERGRLAGGAPVTDDHVAEVTDHGSVDELATALAAGDVKPDQVPDLKPVFRLSPPRGGFEAKGKKRHFSDGGSLGYRGDAINDLIERMI